jgi:hypothetical protein
VLKSDLNKATTQIEEFKVRMSREDNENMEVDMYIYIHMYLFIYINIYIYKFEFALVYNVVGSSRRYIYIYI